MKRAHFLGLLLSILLTPAISAPITEYTIQVGSGPVTIYTNADGTFNATPEDAPHAATFFFLGNVLGQFADLWFDAPSDAFLTPGLYSDAQRYPFQNASNPGLWIAVNGSGPNSITGQFTVIEATYDLTGTIQSFAANYIQYGDGSTVPWTGLVYYNYDPGSSVPEPATFVLLSAGLAILVARSPARPSTRG